MTRKGSRTATHLLSEAAWLNGAATEALAHAEASLEYAIALGGKVSLDGPAYRHQPLVVPRTDRCRRGTSSVFRRLLVRSRAITGPRPSSKSDMAWFLTFLGRFEEARIILRQQSATWEELGDHWRVIECSVNLGQIEWFSGHPSAAEESLRRLLRLSATHRERLAAVLRRHRAGRASHRSGSRRRGARGDERDPERRRAWGRAQTGKVAGGPSVALARLGQLDEAVALVEEAERMARSTDFLSLLAQTMLSKAEVLKLTGRKDEAAVAAARPLTCTRRRSSSPTSAGLDRCSTP